MIDKNRVAFVCIKEKTNRCNGCQYKYPQLTSHNRCNFEDYCAENFVDNDYSLRVAFGLAGTGNNQECITRIKFITV